MRNSTANTLNRLTQLRDRVTEVIELAEAVAADTSVSEVMRHDAAGAVYNLNNTPLMSSLGDAIAAASRKLGAVSAGK